MRLSDEQCRTRFAAARVARLASVAEDGSPRLVPITFAVVGEVIVSAVDSKPKSTAALARLRRIEREPRVSVLVDDYAEDWAQLWWVRADAEAEVVTSGPDWHSALVQLRDKYEQYLLTPPRDAVIRAVVHRWTGWSAA